MKNNEYNIIDDAPRNTHFAAVNSGKGFKSYFFEVFGNERIKKRYIIKGGPGTGKSSFMRRVAVFAEERGREVEYFRCSSDPDSLDGIIIDGSIAVLDGTAPHVYEPSMVGVTDEIVNLGEFWNTDRLYERYNDISELSAQRSAAYFKVYRFLSAMSDINEINDSLAVRALDREKMRAAVERILRQVRRGESFRLEYGLVNAIGMDGLTHISSFEKKAKRLYLIYDCYGLGWHFLAQSVDMAMEKRARVQISYDPLEPHKPDGVYFPDEGIALLTCEGDGTEGAVRINMSRFVIDRAINPVKSEYRHNRRLRDALLSAAVDALSEAGEYHFKLEDIYKDSMDFEAESRFVDEFCQRLF